MAKEGSVAPKERINIKYSPSTGDSKEEVELPFKVMVMGDFTQQEDERPVEERKPININKDNFNEVLSKQNLNIDLNVADKLSEEASGEVGFRVVILRKMASVCSNTSSVLHLCSHPLHKFWVHRVVFSTKH